MQVDNAIIMAAGVSSRFAPLSYEKHKAMIEVKGEIIIERQIKQLIEAGIPKIFVVTGYKAEQFEYLQDKYDVEIIYNPDYCLRNNNSSIYAVKDLLRNSYVCSADNYFSKNPFLADVDEAYYAAVYANGDTKEWCMREDEEGYICSVNIGGKDAWYMLGHTFWSQEFSEKFLEIMLKEYDLPQTAQKLWENILIEHLDTLKMRIRKYEPNQIFEFDTLDELRQFDKSYVDDSRSSIIKAIADELKVTEADIVNIVAIKDSTVFANGFEFDCGLEHYMYTYDSKKIKMF